LTILLKCWKKLSDVCKFSNSDTKTHPSYITSSVLCKHTNGERACLALFRFGPSVWYASAVPKVQLLLLWTKFENQVLS